MVNNISGHKCHLIELCKRPQSQVVVVGSLVRSHVAQQQRRNDIAKRKIIQNEKRLVDKVALGTV